MDRIITQSNIRDFHTWLKSEEKSENTVEKYIRDVTAFMEHLGGCTVTKETVIAYKNKLIEGKYAVRRQG